METKLDGIIKILTCLTFIFFIIALLLFGYLIYEYQRFLEMMSLHYLR